MEKVTGGAFLSSLKRNNKQIRDDRAAAISENAMVLYRRQIEDLELGIRAMERERENMLDLSPTNAQSLILATDFDAGTFVSKDIELGVRIRNDSIKLEIARERFKMLFLEGGE